MSENKKKIYKPRPVSGFPEWLPEVRRVEQEWFDHIRRVFESYGFCSIETPSVEELDAILAKGGDGEADVDKEMYIIRHLSREIDQNSKEPRLALHFDQTVPFARYTAQHFNDLVFPFKRYQMQRVWRGERPQAGRFREFYQCDIDVINVDSLPLHFDAEMPAIIWEILSSLPGMSNENIQIRISNRKILIGVIQNELGVASPEGVVGILRIVDKLEKLALSDFLKMLNQEILERNPDCQEKQILRFVELLALLKNDNSPNLQLQLSALENLIARAERNPITTEGLKELYSVLKSLAHLPEGSVVADLSIVRGLDYYTGTVYETVFKEDPSYGSICSGGRYDDLAGNYINKHLPGVGISIGFSRLFDRIRQQGKLPLKGISPAQFLITLEDESLRSKMMETAQALRAMGHNVETYHSSAKLKKQLEYAMKKGIRYIWLLPFEDRASDEIKDMENRDQRVTTLNEWKK